MLFIFSDSKGNILYSTEVNPTIKGIKIGSSDKCDVCIKFNGIAPEHLLVSINSLGKVFVQDLQSNFGVYVGNKKIMPGFTVEVTNDVKIKLLDDVYLEIKNVENFSNSIFSGYETSIFPFFLYKNQQLLKNAFKEAYSAIPQVYHVYIKKLDDTLSTKIIELSSIIEVSYALNSIISFQRLLEYTVDMALRVTGANRGFIMLYNEESEKLETVVARGIGIKEIEKDLSYISVLVPKCFNSGKQIFICSNSNEIKTEYADIYQSLLNHGITSLVITPLKIENLNIGILYLDSKSVNNEILDNSLDALKFFAAHASIAINKARLFHMATTDSLTGLVNQKHFYQRFIEEYYRALRHQKPLSLVALDIDNFKSINEKYGLHLADQVLIKVSRMFRSLTRVHDLLCRYDGDMFMLLLPETPIDGANKVAEKLKQLLESTTIKVNKRNISVTGSFGVVSIEPGVSKYSKPNQIILEAVKALTEAKSNGGNKIIAKYKSNANTNTKKTNLQSTKSKSK